MERDPRVASTASARVSSRVSSRYPGGATPGPCLLTLCTAAPRVDPSGLHHATYAFVERSSGNVAGRSERTPSSTGGGCASASILGASRTYLSISHCDTVNASVGLATKVFFCRLGSHRCEMSVSGLSNRRRVFGGHWSTRIVRPLASSTDIPRFFGSMPKLGHTRAGVRGGTGDTCEDTKRTDRLPPRQRRRPGDESEPARRVSQPGSNRSDSQSGFPLVKIAGDGFLRLRMCISEELEFKLHIVFKPMGFK